MFKSIAGNIIIGTIVFLAIYFLILRKSSNASKLTKRKIIVSYILFLVIFIGVGMIVKAVLQF